MNGAGFDWLNIAGLSSDSNLPPPPVSFGVTPTSSTSSVDLVSQQQQQHQREKSTSLSQKSQSEDNLATAQPSYVETDADTSVPLSLTVDQLTKDEAKTYLRWYNDIVVRRNTKLIRLKDVFNFLSNFKLNEHVRNILERIFRSCSTLNIGEFFALLRLISHAIMGQIIPARRLIKEPAPIPKPKSILSRKRMNDVENDDDDNDKEGSNNEGNDNNPITTAAAAASNADSSKFDLDSFTQFILTGERPGTEDSSLRRRKKNALSKRVKFSDEVSVEPSAEASSPPVNLDLTLPMDQLIGRFPKHEPKHEKNINEEEELKEMQDSFDHFKNIKNVDSALIHGTPANIPSIFFDNEMSQNNNSPRVASPDPSSQVRLLSPNHTGPVNTQGLLPPNHTGPAGNSGLLQPTTTGGGDEFLNSLLSPNNTTGHQQQQSLPHSNGYLSPNYTGQANEAPLQPTMTGSVAPSMRQSFGLNQRVSSASPSFGNSNNLSVPMPPQSRQRSLSSPIPFDPSLQQRVTSPISSTRSPPPPPPPRARANTTTSQAPPPPPSRNSHPGPALPPKIPMQNTSSPSPSFYQQQQQPFQQNNPYVHNNDSTSSSTADILGDLKALQSEVDRLQYYQR